VEIAVLDDTCTTLFREIAKSKEEMITEQARKVIEFEAGRLVNPITVERAPSPCQRADTRSVVLDLSLFHDRGHGLHDLVANAIAD